MFTPRFVPVGTNGSREVNQDCTRVQTWRDLSGAVCAHGYAGPGGWSIELPQTGTFRLRRGSLDAIDVYPAPDAPRARIEDLYRRTVVPLFLQALGSETLHASAITMSRGAIAFCGERGAGKSTIAYALAARGFPQHADDTLVFNVGERSVTTEPLPFVPRLRPASAAFFRDTTHGNGPFMVARPQPAPLSAVFVLHRDEARVSPEVKPLAPAHAFKALLDHAHCFEPENPVERRRLLANYLDVSTRVSVFKVTFAPGLEALDTLLDRMLVAAAEACGDDPPEGGSHTCDRGRFSAKRVVSAVRRKAATL